MPKLTDAQIAALVAKGLPDRQIRALNESPMDASQRAALDRARAVVKLSG